MRYAVQFAVPIAIIVALAFWVFTRRRQPQSTQPPLLSVPAFLAFLLVAIAFTAALLFGVGTWANASPDTCAELGLAEAPCRLRSPL